MKVTAKRRAYNAKYYRNHPEIWARSNARRKALRPVFTPKIDWADREAVRLYDQKRNREYREAHPGWTAAKCKAWRAKRRLRVATERNGAKVLIAWKRDRW